MTSGQTRRTWVARAVTAATLVLVIACDDFPVLPTAPSELTSGIALYEHADYGGESALITEDIENLEEVRGPCRKPADDGEEEEIGWSDCLSSIRVAPGWRANLYRDDGFKGERLQITGDVPNLTHVAGNCPKGGFNDCVTSIRVIRP